MAHKCPMSSDDPLPQQPKPEEYFEDHKDDPAEDDEEEDPEEDDEEEDPEEEDPEEDDEDDPEEDNEEDADTNSRPQQSQHTFMTTPTWLEEEDEAEENCEGESETDSGFVTRLNSHSAPGKPECVSLASPMPLKLKRPAETSEKEGSRLKKVKSENEASHGVVTEKKPAFTRLFSKEDEITILKGIILFTDTKGIDPNSDSTAFHKFLKTDISVDVSKDQLMDKISRLKTKFKKSAEKGDETGFSKSHDSEVYELSKEIWGGNEVVNEKKKPVDDSTVVFVTALAAANQNLPLAVKKQQVKTNVIDVGDVNGEEKKNEQGEFSTLYPFMSASLKMKDNLSAFLGSTMESCLILMKKSKLEELEKEWKKQILDELQLQLRRSVLLQKQIEAAIDSCSGRV